MTSRWLIFTTLLLSACTEYRQFVLSIDTTASIPCDVDRIRVVAIAAGTTTVEQSLTRAQIPIDITLLDDTPSGSFQVEISAFKGDVEVMRVIGPLQFTSRRTRESVLLQQKCTPQTPCEIAEAMTAAAGAPTTPRPSCGANVRRYRAAPPLDTFIDACALYGMRSVLFGDAVGPVRLTDLEPMLQSSSFEFYGRPIRQVWVSRNGYISFGQDNPDPRGANQPGALDRDIRHLGSPPPLQSVMAFWDKLSLGPRGVCYEIDGAPRSQQLRVTWNHACLTAVCQTDNLNFTITLDEVNQRVLLTYGAMDAGNQDGARGSSATVGLVNDATGCPTDSCELETGLCNDGVTPCGYSQVFSSSVQMPGVSNMQFIPIIDPE
jgi:hypothetical protein